MENKKSIKFLLNLFYVIVVVSVVGFGFYFYNEQYSFLVAKSDISMLNNSNYQIEIIGQNEQYSSEQCIYENANPDIISVDKSGNIKALKEGTAQVIVKSKKGFNKKTVNVKVSENSLYLVSFENEDINLNLNEEYKINPLINNESGIDTNVTYNSSDSSVVSVDKDGNIKANKEGTAYIEVKVKDTDYTSRIKIDVNEENSSTEVIDNDMITLMHTYL